MLLKQVMQVVELLDRQEVPAEDVAEFFVAPGVPGVEIHAERGPTLMFKLLIPGSEGKSMSGDAPTLGITGYLGGIGARPQRIGLVSDADGCVATLAAALKLVQMHRDGDRLPGDVLVTTHITTRAVIKPHHRLLSWTRRWISRRETGTSSIRAWKRFCRSIPRVATGSSIIADLR